MPDANGAETFAERLLRVRGEVSSLRAAIQSQLDSGAEKGTGVFRITEVAFESLRKRLNQKEAELAGLEAQNANDTAGMKAGLGLLQTSTRGHPA